MSKLNLTWTIHHSLNDTVGPRLSAQQKGRIDVHAFALPTGSGLWDEPLRVVDWANRAGDGEDDFSDLFVYQSRHTSEPTR